MNIKIVNIINVFKYILLIIGSLALIHLLIATLLFKLCSSKESYLLNESDKSGKCNIEYIFGPGIYMN